MKSLRAEPYESTLPSRVRRAVLHAQKYDLVEHQTVALASLGADRPEVTDPDEAHGRSPSLTTHVDRRPRSP